MNYQEFIKIFDNSIDPGYTATDFNNHRGTGTVTQATEAIIRFATSGIFFPPVGVSMRDFLLLLISYNT
jgi:hypothetical protein